MRWSKRMNNAIADSMTPSAKSGTTSAVILVRIIRLKPKVVRYYRRRNAGKEVVGSVKGEQKSYLFSFQPNKRRLL